ncbi:amino acid permease/ SLC12A domain-containing protein [Chytridium lagenaria]|nr:amino acid permease/ SLC12A domain-containing protein [Chytridium lagenaria]
MMSVGGTIGTGIFVASGLTIAMAGPGGALMAYGIVAVMVFAVLTSLGEMSTLLPVSGSFHEFAGRFFDPALSWTLGWNYWFQWAISLPAELSATGIIMSYWFPNIPGWIWSLSLLLMLLFINTRGVQRYGEIEFWLSLVKVIAIIVFIVIGLYTDIFGFPDKREYIGFRYWNMEGAPFKNGMSGMLSVITIAFFSFGGTELVGISAGEVEEPQKNVPKAINNTFLRILLFYVLTIGTIGLLIPNNDPALLLGADSDDIGLATFTLVFVRAGLTSAAHIMNFVILTAVVSAANSAMYAASRTLASLAMTGRAPEWLGVINEHGVPLRSVAVTTLVSTATFLGLVIGEGSVFAWLLSLTGVSGLLTWMSISVIHIRFRAAHAAQGKHLDDLPYKSPLGRVGDMAAICIGLLIMIGQVSVSCSIFLFFKKYMYFLKLYQVGIPLFLGLYFGYKRVRKAHLIPLEECNFQMPIEHES